MEHYSKELRNIIQNDKYMMTILEAVSELDLEDGWVSAGLIRNKVWDKLEKRISPINDIDVIYFDEDNLSSETEKLFENKLGKIYPNQPWSVKNQARMHLKSGFSPFTSVYDGVAHFPETPTAVAVRLKRGKLEIIAPYGLQDLFEMNVKPTSFYKKGSEYYPIYLERIQNKNWKDIWKRLTIER